MTRRPALVMDASVAVSIIRREPTASTAVVAISDQTHLGGRIVVPAHFWLEVTNSLMGRWRMPSAEALQALHDLDEMQLETLAVDRHLVVFAIDLSERHGLTSHDAAYLALAISMDAHLATFDEALRVAAGPRAIHIGPPRLSESPTIYEHSVTWPNYKGASAFIAKLRAEAARPG